MNALKANYTIEKVRQLQRKLYQTAKLNSKRRFHALYDKLSQPHILEEAWKRVRKKKGSGGIDGQTIADIERQGVEPFLAEIRENLISGTYRPQPVKRIFIPKPDGRKRPLGLPIIKDKIVQTAVKLVIEPIFEADFKPCSYGFRPKRTQHMALKDVWQTCRDSGNHVIDADIEGFFDAINHQKLMVLLEKRISDRRILKLIRQWLTAGVMTETGIETTDQGSPQGGVISPLLANIYLNYMDTLWEKHGTGYGKLIRFADDSIIICKTEKQAKEAMALLKEIMRRLELTLNPDKTKTVNLWNGKEGFDYLGFHNRKMKRISQKRQTCYKMEQFPSAKSQMKMRNKIREELGFRHLLSCSMDNRIEELNPVLRGWKNYYGYGNSKTALNKTDRYILEKFTLWNNKKRQNPEHRKGKWEFNTRLQKRGLIKLAS